jgi:homoserine kinase
MEFVTKESRGALPKYLPFADASNSVNSAAYLAAVFASGDFEKLRGAVCDFMHEPYRFPKIPGAREAIAAGIAAGALTGWLSGSGSSVLCISRQPDGAAVGRAMSAAFDSAGLSSEVRLLVADNVGLCVEPCVAL